MAMTARIDQLYVNLRAVCLPLALPAGTGIKRATIKYRLVLADSLPFEPAISPHFGIALESNSRGITPLLLSNAAAIAAALVILSPFDNPAD